jgi:Lrp/AsnC family leucine-responsive transcriptional regulator
VNVEGESLKMTQELNGKRIFSYKPSEGLLDQVDIRLLEKLQRDPRLTKTELGRRVGMSSPAVAERVRRMEESGIILGYRMDVNPAALGLSIAAYIRIRPNPGQLPKLAELAQQIPEVVECHRITGEDCFILKVYIPSMNQLDRLLDIFQLHGLTTTSIIQSTPVSLRNLPLPEC